MDIFHAFSASDLGVLALGLVIAGTVGGLLSGVLGMGGGIVVVPVLYHVLATLGLDASVRMHVAIGTALAASIPAAISGAQNAMSQADRSLFRRWIVPALAGVAIGSWLFSIASAPVLALIFAVLAAIVVLYLLLDRKEHMARTRLPGKIADLVLPVILGGASAMTGMGSMTIAGPVLALHPSPTEERPATPSILGLVVAVPASVGAVIAGWRAQPLPPDSLGYANLLGFALIAPILLLMEPAGAALAHMIDRKRLRLVLSALITIITARMLWDALA